jgi:hypothetical protein
MVIIGLVEEILGILMGLLGHFVTPSYSIPTVSADYEWFVMQATPAELTVKGNYLMGAVADIVTYGAILVDWIIQALMSNSQNVNTVPM